MNGSSAVAVVGIAAVHDLLEEDLVADVDSNGILEFWNGRRALQNGDNANYHCLQNRMSNP